MKNNNRYFIKYIAPLVLLSLVSCTMSDNSSDDTSPQSPPQYPPKIDGTIRVYFIGNSLTLSTTLDRIFDLAKDQGVTLDFGSQLSGGKSLIRHLNYRDEPDQEWISWETNIPSGESFLPDTNPHISNYFRRFGLYDEALANCSWDYLILQTYAGNLHDDMMAISAFTDMALERNADIQVLIYSTWPVRPGNVPINYPEVWGKKYASDIHDTSSAADENIYTHNYSRRLLAEFDKKYPGLNRPVQIIPVGDVLLKVDQQIKNGQLNELEVLAEIHPELVPGYTSGTFFEDGVNVLYADIVHLNPFPYDGSSVGIFLVGTAVAASLICRSPVGLSAEAYDLNKASDIVLITKLQSAINDVLVNDPRSCVYYCK